VTDDHAPLLGPVDPPEEWHTGRLLVTAARLLEHAFGALLAEHDLTVAGMTVLHVLRDGPLAQNELAQRCQVEAQTMSRTVERLERSGYVERTRAADDRRRLCVARTPAGHQVAELLAERTSRALPVLDELEEPEVFRRQLLHIVRRVGGDRWQRGCDPSAPQDRDGPPA